MRVTTMTQKPTALRKGGAIRAVAPASSELDQSELSKGLLRLRELGFEVTLGDCVRKLRTHGYLSGRDNERAEELNEAFRDDNVDTVFCVTGGYGTPRILPYLDYNVIREKPKMFLGYSDITYGFKRHLYNTLDTSSPRHLHPLQAAVAEVRKWGLKLRLLGCVAQICAFIATSFAIFSAILLASQAWMQRRSELPVPRRNVAVYSLALILLVTIRVSL